MNAKKINELFKELNEEDGISSIFSLAGWEVSNNPVDSTEIFLQKGDSILNVFINNTSWVVQGKFNNGQIRLGGSGFSNKESLINDLIRICKMNGII